MEGKKYHRARNDMVSILLKRMKMYEVKFRIDSRENPTGYSFGQNGPTMSSSSIPISQSLSAEFHLNAEQHGSVRRDGVA